VKTPKKASPLMWRSAWRISRASDDLRSSAEL
jgi:hypothetical protein